MKKKRLRILAVIMMLVITAQTAINVAAAESYGYGWILKGGGDSTVGGRTLVFYVYGDNGCPSTGGETYLPPATLEYKSGDSWVTASYKTSSKARISQCKKWLATPTKYLYCYSYEGLSGPGTYRLRVYYEYIYGTNEKSNRLATGSYQVTVLEGASLCQVYISLNVSGGNRNGGINEVESGSEQRSDKSYWFLQALNKVLQDSIAGSVYRLLMYVAYIGSVLSLMMIFIRGLLMQGIPIERMEARRALVRWGVATLILFCFGTALNVLANIASGF